MNSPSSRLFAFLCVLASGFWCSLAHAHHFIFHPPPDAKITSSTRVALTGDFLGWTPTGVQMSPQPDGTFTIDHTVPDGRHLYKFTLNAGERWLHDDQNPAREDDGSGGYNSIITISGGKAVETTGSAN